jgi:hypothetical protein
MMTRQKTEDGDFIAADSQVNLDTSKFNDYIQALNTAFYRLVHLFV